MMHSTLPTKTARCGSMPGRMQRRASLSAKPERRGSLAGPSHIMLSWFQASETVDDDKLSPSSISPSVNTPSPPPSPSPVVEEVQITGLELLKQNHKNIFEDDECDDFSFDSYARDSFKLARNKQVRKLRPKTSHTRLVQSEHRSTSVMSTSLDDDDEMDSMARDYYDYGPPQLPAHLDRRGSIHTRSSVGSYANDSVEFARYKATRRQDSVGSLSFANDSAECRNMRTSRFANSNPLGTSWHSNNKKYDRRGSLGSLTMESSTAGRRFVFRGSVTRRHSSHCCEMDKMRKSLEGRPFTRRSSLGSVSSGVSLSLSTSMSTGFSRTA